MTLPHINFEDKIGNVMFVSILARQGNDGGILWEVYIYEVEFGGTNTIATVSATGKVQAALKRWWPRKNWPERKVI